jgi:hypothetical protein
MPRMEEDVVFSNLRDKLFTAVVGDVLDKMGWRPKKSQRLSIRDRQPVKAGIVIR